MELLGPGVRGIHIKWLFKRWEAGNFANKYCVPRLEPWPGKEFRGQLLATLHASSQLIVSKWAFPRSAGPRLSVTWYLRLLLVMDGAYTIDWPHQYSKLCVFLHANPYGNYVCQQIWFFISICTCCFFLFSSDET